MRERFGRLEGLVVAFVGDGNNVYHSLALLGGALGMEIRLAHPAGYAPNERIVARAQRAGGRVGRAADRSATTRTRRSAARPSCTPTPGRRWARRPRPRSAATRSPGFQRRRRPARRGRPRRRRDALPAGPSRRGDHVRGDGRTAEPDLGPVGEPAARPEGAARRDPRRGRRHERSALRAVQGGAPARPPRDPARAPRRRRRRLSRGGPARAGPRPAAGRARRRAGPAGPDR